MMQTPNHFFIHPRIQRARRVGRPLVALESALITHGLPAPHNLETALAMEAAVEAGGAEPATIAVVEGRVKVGLEKADIEKLASVEAPRKVSLRDYAAVLADGASGGTTVAATMHAAQVAGIQVFATGGIGGVHHAPAYDVSADLPTLARTPMIVVCSGAKAILDLAATLEYLETHSVPVVGFGTDDFPAFFALGSGLPVSVRLDEAEAVVRLAQSHWDLGFRSAVLVAQPAPEEAALDRQEMEAAVKAALEEAEQAGVRGQDVTPFLLTRVAEETGAASLEANVRLLENNASLAAQIAAALAKRQVKAIGFV